MNELPPKASSLETRGVHIDDDRIADYLIPHTRSARTLAAYTDVLGRFQWWCQRANISSILDTTEADARRFQIDLARGAVPSAAAAEAQIDDEQQRQRMTPLSPFTVDHYVGIVQTFFDHLMRQGNIASNPFFELPKVSIEDARGSRKVRALDDVGAVALVDTIALWPRHTRRHNAIFQQARWIVCLATKCALSPTQVASESMSSLKHVSDRWCIDITSVGGLTKRVLVDEHVVEAFAEYRTWVRSFVGLTRIARLPGSDDEPKIPLVGSISDPRLPIMPHRVSLVLRRVVAETITRLQEAGEATLAQSLETFKPRQTTADEVVREIARKQRAAGDTAEMTKRFHWVQDCPPGPVYISRAERSGRLVAGNRSERVD